MTPTDSFDGLDDFAGAGCTTGGTWDRPSRPRTDTHPTGPKTRWRHRLET